ncbi:alpha-(1,3)-fucosyltransferase 10 [Lingula anatina]|uniref:Fucosyltransferase n=1 Tax=Lingula anatina TaxID=7574 RepID=A0A1S3ICC8_LINAN|nr:alpha-(1,3)-fucosyltransferase 10 [Lingula anatina]|eukprot:XP_013395516.1 alpha-(1,3)-fucosyltransferase 10 [Lingula anatina]
MASYRWVFRTFLLSFLVILLVIIVVGFQMFKSAEDDLYSDMYDRALQDDEMQQVVLKSDKNGDPHVKPVFQDNINVPVLVWWTPFTGEKGRVKSCGDVKCFFTVNRTYKDHPRAKVFMFYGTDISPPDLPIPRQPHHEWALLHEESPKNEYLFSHADIMTLFNHTCTFKRESDYPTTTLYLKGIEELESTEYLVPIKEKNNLLSQQAPVAFVHSDCGTPSDREKFTERLMKFIPVDSMGKCLHNKDLPKELSDPLKGMSHKDFYKIMAGYKFTMAFENGVCDDYVTEKFWRPLQLGSVPIVFGSPKIKDLMPSNHSIIDIRNYKTIKELADHLNFLNNNDDEYQKYLQFKKPGGVTNTYLKEIMERREWGIDNDWQRGNFIDGFECHVCRRLHENEQLIRDGKKPRTHIATVDHYGCPKPKRFKADGSTERVEDDWWAQEWISTKYQAKAIRYYIDRGLNFTQDEFLKMAADLSDLEHR